MLTQYTRESPAKRGWAIGGMVVAFAATLGLAQWTMGHRKVSYRQELEGWPIAFTLPTSGHWVRARGTQLFDGVTHEHEAIFAGHTDSLEQCWLVVSCDTNSDGPAFIDLINKMSHALVGDAKPIQIGPLKGILTQQVLGQGQVMSEAAANGSSGLEVRIILVAEGSKSGMLDLIEKVCHSVEIKSAATGKKK